MITETEETSALIGTPTHLSHDEVLEMGVDADYVLIFIAGMKMTGPNAPPYYILEGGGDESKKSWFM